MWNAFCAHVRDYLKTYAVSAVAIIFLVVFGYTPTPQRAADWIRARAASTLLNFLASMSSANPDFTDAKKKLHRANDYAAAIRRFQTAQGDVVLKALREYDEVGFVQTGAFELSTGQPDPVAASSSNSAVISLFAPDGTRVRLQLKVEGLPHTPLGGRPYEMIHSWLGQVPVCADDNSLINGNNVFDIEVNDIAKRNLSVNGQCAANPAFQTKSDDPGLSSTSQNNNKDPAFYSIYSNSILNLRFQLDPTPQVPQPKRLTRNGSGIV